MYTGNFCSYCCGRRITCTEASSASVEASSSNSFEACTTCTMHHASSSLLPWNLQCISSGSVRVSTDSRGPGTCASFPPLQKSRVVSTSTDFDQISSFILQSALCWTRRGDGNAVGVVIKNVCRSFHSQHERPVELINSAVHELRVGGDSISRKKTSRRTDVLR